MQLKYSIDGYCAFDIDAHTYKNLKSNKYLKSVTSLIKAFSNEFDAEYWSDVIAKREGKTKEDILLKWQKKGEESREKGTFYHKIIEDFINDGEFIEYNNSASMFIKDYFLTQRIIPLCSELIVYNDFIAGQIDLLCMDKINNYYIFDFKTNEKISNNSYGKKLKYPFNDIDDSTYYKYSLQLSFYKYLINKEIKDLYIIHLSENKYEFIKAIDLSLLIKNNFDAILKNT